jgi:hypothetical protein
VQHFDGSRFIEFGVALEFLSDAFSMLAASSGVEVQYILVRFS